MVVVLMLVFRGRPEYTMTIISGCFLVEPFLTMGLYDLSRRRAAGLPQDLGTLLAIPCLGHATWHAYREVMRLVADA